MISKICPRCAGSGKIIDDAATGETLRAERLEAGITLAAQASQMQCSMSYVSLIERGQRGWSEGKIAIYRAALALLKAKARYGQGHKETQ